MLTHPLLPVRRRHRGAVVLALIAIAASLALFTQQLEIAPDPATAQVAKAARYSPEVVPEARVVPAGLTSATLPPVPFAVRRGQTPSGLLLELGVESQDVGPALAALGEHVDLRRLRAGETGFAYYDEEGALDRLRLRLASRGWVTLEQGADGYDVEFRALRRRVSVERSEGVLTSSLLGAVAADDAPASLAYAMANVLQWDLDFNRDLRQGDRFQVVYETETIEGRAPQVRRVFALAYENRGVVHEAYLWTDENGDEGYYDGEGRPLRKMFLRSPLPFTRVTSRFTHRRFHPVLKKYRPHYGVDFGAPTGTPIRVTASGTVTVAGRRGGAGNMVKVRHANGYETMYLHLSRFAQGVRSGSRVRQGDLIGYVGSTGLSTGPHLDYRVKRRGQYLDPMKLENRPAEPVPEHRRAAFREHLEELRSALGGGDPGVLAPPTFTAQIEALSELPGSATRQVASSRSRTSESARGR